MLRIVSWNVQWGRGVDGWVDLERIVGHARRCADFDILCLQEVAAGYSDLAGCDGADQFEALSRLLPDYHAIRGIATDAPAVGDARGPRRQFGNMIFSRWPVRQIFRHSLPWPADRTVPSMQRVALEVNVQTESGLLRITTTHLEYYSATQC